MPRHPVSKLPAIVVGVTLCLGVGWWTIRTTSNSSKFNIILITLDTVRADRVGCYGYKPAQTPNLDELAQSGVTFEFTRTPYPLTLPAHASVFTGLNPPEHGLQVNGRGRLSDEIPILAELLKRASYETAAFTAAYVLNRKFGLNRGFDRYNDELSVSKSQEATSDRRRDGKIVLNLTLDWLKSRTSRPFFCWIHLYDPHSPYDSRTEQFGTTFEDRAYDAGIAYADLQIGRLRNFLDHHKLTDRTLIVVVGDHGESLGEHNEPDHGYQLYESTLRVPMIWWGPSFIKPGTRVTTPVSLIDVLPTIMDCLQLNSSSRVSGRSLKPALADKSIPCIPCYSESELAFLESRCAPLRCVTTDRWKFIETTRAELYDVVADPQELVNLAPHEPERVKEFSNILEQIRETMTPVKADSVNLSPEEKRILAGLGYVGGSGSYKPPVPGDQLLDVKDALPNYNQLMRAREQIDRGDLSGAKRLIRKILEEIPGYSTARFLLADLLIREKQFAEAAHEYSVVIESQPENAEAHAYLGNALSAAGLFQEAASHYRKAIEFDPQGSTFRYYFSFTLVRLGKSAEALRELKEAIRINPEFVDGRLQLSKLLAESGNVIEAEKQFNAILKYQPKMPRPAWLGKK